MQQTKQLKGKYRKKEREKIHTKYVKSDMKKFLKLFRAAERGQ